MTTDNIALARFITSLGSMNDYGSTLLQTKKALDKRDVSPLRDDVDDRAIFTDALKGIEAIKSVGFSTDGIIAINRSFDSDSEEEPVWPGHLRNANYNADDNIGITTGTNGRGNYIPPQHITKEDLDQIVGMFASSDKDEKDAWRVFASLAKLQPFQDGNKRTALIAANSAMGTLQTQDYLVLPFNEVDRLDFMVGLMRYYQAETPQAEEKALDRMVALTPSETERTIELNAPIENHEEANLRTKRMIRSRRRLER